MKEAEEEEKIRRRDERIAEKIYMAGCPYDFSSNFVTVTSMGKIQDAYNDYMMSTIF